MKKLSILFIGLFFFSLVGCFKDGTKIVFDNSDPLAMDIEVQWAVITAPYAACRKEPSYQAETIAHFRRGALVQIKGVQTVISDDLAEKWYNFDEGWVVGNALTVYSNKLKAQKALNEMVF